jgi:hypothetical protein
MSRDKLVEEDETFSRMALPAGLAILVAGVPYQISVSESGFSGILRGRERTAGY